MGLLDIFKKDISLDEQLSRNNFFNAVAKWETQQFPETYIVKSGDSLFKIAQRFYGDAREWKRIYIANKDRIKNPYSIQPGQIFRIPSI